jgi:ribonuclease P/MRP protein subunit RPP1
LIAIQPTTDKVFQAVCKEGECDIITFDMSARLAFYIKHSTVFTALQRGIHFELSYSGCIRDTTARRNIISNALQLIRATRGKNIILSAGLVDSMAELRSPYDLVHLGCIFGLRSTAARECLRENTRKVLHHAEARKNTYRAVIQEQKFNSEPMRTVKRRRE